MTKEQQEQLELVRDFCKLWGVELVELALRSDLPITTLSQFERGDWNLSGSEWKQVSDAIQKIMTEKGPELWAEHLRLKDWWMSALTDPSDLTNWRAKAALELPKSMQEQYAKALNNPLDPSNWIGLPFTTGEIEKRQGEIIKALEIWERVKADRPREYRIN